MAMPDGDHKRLMLAAVTREAEGQQLLLDGHAESGTVAMRDAARLYRESWLVAPPESFGRLIGLMKAAIIGGDAGDGAAFTRSELPDPPPSAPAAYALALACLVDGDDVAAAAATLMMREGSPAFARTADAVVALARGDRDTYGHAVAAIITDFETRTDHLTGVPIADTALMLERLAEPRGLAVHPASPLLPPIS